jgi:hypothetical protein
LTNNGGNWSQVNSGLNHLAVYSLVVGNGYLFAGTGGGGVFLSSNDGTNWTPVGDGLPNTRIARLAVRGTDLYAGTSSASAWRRPLSEMGIREQPNLVRNPGFLSKQVASKAEYRYERYTQEASETVYYYPYSGSYSYTLVSNYHNVLLGFSIFLPSGD